MIGCVGLVLGFRTSSNLAAAYGIAVTATMVITSILFFVIATQALGVVDGARPCWSSAPLLAIDLAFLAANVPKIPSGGWFPLGRGVWAARADGHLAPRSRARRRPHPSG